ncbi:cellulase [Plectosphaerella plurivora]|uniref:Cellulase n=1 Tax=Plectosphaerella plurivora TaxID=936078 RepID=A0A9P9ACW0_9PEZI|nr:cellulase [Plectosphaerella plurivora]
MICSKAFLLLACVLTAAVDHVAAYRPSLPLYSSSRWIVDAKSERVKLRCINWAAHLEVNIPEGLHRQSIESIADWIAGEGFNCVRLTFSTDHALNPHIRVEDGFRNGAKAGGVDEASLMKLYGQAVERNPFLARATQRDVFDKVIRALWERDVMTMLDNHISRAGWCCDLGDGNGWWKDARFYWAANSRYFDTKNWLDGLSSMSAWAATHQGVVGLGIRNELRATWTQIPFAAADWYSFVARGARAVHTAAPHLLVVIGGLNSATDFTPLRQRALDVSGWPQKTVWEAHDYAFTVTTPDIGGNCDAQRAQYGLLYGFVLEQGKQYTGPLWMSEFGVDMTGGSESGLSQDHYAYLRCLVDWLESNDADWAIWAIQGSYYIRQGRIDADETWGALDRGWNDWRNPQFKGLLRGMFSVTQGP